MTSACEAFLIIANLHRHFQGHAIPAVELQRGRAVSGVFYGGYVLFFTKQLAPHAFVVFQTVITSYAR